MKKILTLTSVLALAACGNHVKEMDNHFAGCERIETTKVHLVYKCPANQEWAQKVKLLKPTGKFRAGGHFNLDEMYNDTANVYVEVSLNDKNLCKEDFTIRTMVAKPGKDNWAVIGCK